MKKLIVTRADSGINDITKLTFPLIKDYCVKCGADFEVLSHVPPVMTDDNHPHFRILYLFTLYDEYDRILSLDSDMLINKDCPDLFEIVPNDCIGTIFEDRGTRKANRRRKIADIQKMYGDVGWKSGYINTSLLMTSLQHRGIFTSINGNYYTKDGSDDLHLGYQIHRYRFPIYELPFQFNHMTMFSESWNGSADRFKSHIIHYAGAGIFGDAKSRQEQIELDYRYIYG